MSKKISQNYLLEQKRLHEINKSYGVASLKHVQTIKNLMFEAKLKSLCDYGAGKKNLYKGLIDLGFKDFEYYPYDPVFPEYGEPERAELVCCIDVMEHIEEEFLENILYEIFQITLKFCYFSIATTPAKKILSDGRNAHIIQKPSRWWLPKLCKYFNVEFLKNNKNGFIVLCKAIETKP